ncbi:ATPase [Rhodobacterales bacterium HKCCE2091]|nr:ATPase [Rhodobacterales bacterium HKCCE2091]
MRETPVIAVDGGGSGCRALLRLSDGATRTAEDGPANAYSDLDTAAARIAGLVLRLSDAAGIDVPPVTAGVAGCRLPEIAGALAGRLPFPARVVDDSVTAARGALGDRNGVLAALGTGSFFLRQSGGAVAHVGGWGFTFGDRASGAWIGRAAVEAALRAADGMAAPDALTDALIAPHPLLRFRGATPADLAALAPLVLDHAGTPTADRLIAEAGAEIAAALEALGSPGSEPLVLSGGFGRALAPHLPGALRARLAEPLGTPLDGALALALEAA